MFHEDICMLKYESLELELELELAASASNGRGEQPLEPHQRIGSLKLAVLQLHLL